MFQDATPFDQDLSNWCDKHKFNSIAFSKGAPLAKSNQPARGALVNSCPQ